MSIFVGSGVALVTPFDENGAVNYDVLARLIEFQLDNGTDAIITCGTTGEASTLTDDEQIEVIRFTVDRVKKRVPVIAGAGSNFTEHGIALCRLAQKAGADALLLVTPYYNKTTQKGLIAHFNAQAAAVDIPVILYNVPSRTGLNMTPETVNALSYTENIVAIKEASGNITQVVEIAALCDGRLDIYSGNDDQVVPLLSLGGKGVISVAANIIPKQMHDLVTRYLSGDTQGGLALQLGIMGLYRALFCEVNPIPVKAAMNMMGLQAGGYRKPLVEMEPAHLAFLEKEMKAYGLIAG